MLGIIIINWNGLSDTLACLQSIEKHNTYPNTNIYIVDNNSTESLDALFNFQQNSKLNLTIIKNNVNEGFAKGNNIGVDCAIKNGCNYILLLNNDTVLVEETFYNLITAYKKSNFEVLGVNNFYYSNPNKLWQSGWKLNQVYNLKHINIDKEKLITEADYIPGSSLFTTTKVIESIGLFDEQYFAYWEETDFCIRAKKKGYKVGFLNNSKILHKVGQSSNSKIQDYFFYRNRLYFYSKHFKKNGKVIIMIWIHTILKMVQKFFKLKFSNSYAIFNACIDFKNKNLFKGSYLNKL